MSEQGIDQTGITVVESATGSDFASTPAQDEYQQSAPEGSHLSRSSLMTRFHARVNWDAIIAISALLGVLIVIFPQVKFGSDTPAVQMDPGPALVSNVQLEERRVLTDEGEANRVSFTVELLGDGNHKVYVGYAVFDAVDEKRLSPPTHSEKEFIRLKALTQEVPNDRESHLVDVPVPPERHCVFVRVYLYGSEDASSRLDFGDTLPFDTHEASNDRCIELGVSPDPRTR